MPIRAKAGVIFADCTARPLGRVFEDSETDVRSTACEYRKSIEFTERSVTRGFVSSAALAEGWQRNVPWNESTSCF